MKSKKEITSSFIWRFLERCGAQGVTFIVSVILARLLDPGVYGTVALVTVFTSILHVFLDSGMGTALVQKKDVDDLDFSTVFFFNIALCLVLYTVIFICAPLIADFYNNPQLKPLVRVLSLTLLVSGVKNVQQAYVSRHLLFKQFFFATLGGTIGAAFVGIWMAYRGYGVWALVVQSLFNHTIDTIILWAAVKWRPKRMFSMERLKVLYSFGWKMLASSLLDAVYTELRALIIGKKYTKEDLAYYNRGAQFPKLFVTNINTSIDSVILPTMSLHQDNRDVVRHMTRTAIKTSTYLMMPMMMGLAVCAVPVVDLVLTEKWLPAVFFLRIYCFTLAFQPIHTANLNAIKAMGRSDMFLKLEIIKKIIGMIGLLSTMFISVKAMAISMLVVSVINQMVNSWPNRKLLGYRYIDQIRDMLPQILLSLGMGLIVYCVTFLGLSDIWTLVIQVPLGVAIYVIGSKVFKIDSYNFVLGIIRSYFGRKEKKNS